jgi:hypothetical protein
MYLYIYSNIYRFLSIYSNISIGISNICNNIVLTDGHPDCVLNQNVCIQMCKQTGLLSKDINISSKQLRWFVLLIFISLYININ